MLGFPVEFVLFFDMFPIEFVVRSVVDGSFGVYV